VRRYLNRLGDGIRRGLAERDATISPRLRTLIAIAVPLILLYIVAAILVVPADEPQNYNFVSERGAVTVLNAILLAAASGFGFVAFLLTEGSSRIVRWFWLLVAIAIGFLAMDELLGFHEGLGGVLDDIDPLGLKSARTIRGWNDVVVIAYGIAALPVVITFLPTMVRIPAFPELSAVAFAWYVLHTAVDSLVEPRTNLSVIVEESAKLFTGLILALACLGGLLSYAAPETSTDP